MSRKRFAKFAVLSVLSLTSLIASAASTTPTYETKGPASMAIKVSLSPGGSFTGGCADNKCTGLKLTESDDSYAISIPFSSLQAGTGMVFGGRTEHMRKVFHKGRVVVTIPKSELTLPADGKTVTVSPKGKLSLKWVESEKTKGGEVSKTFNFTIKRAGNTYSISKGSFKLDLLNDFKLDSKEKINKMGVSVKPAIEVTDITFSVVAR